MRGRFAKRTDEQKRKWQKRRQRLNTHPYLTAVYVVLRLIVVMLLALNIWERDYESAYICVLALILFFLPHFIEHRFRIRIPTLMEVVILLFIFGAQILGELQNYYTQYPYWDTMLHAVNGFVCAAFGFSLMDILSRNRQEKFRLSPWYVSLVAFCFSMTVGVLWEFFEYSVDVLLLTDMQKDTVVHSLASASLSADGEVVKWQGVTAVTVNGQPLPVGGYLDIGLHDTMMDLFVNFLGAAVFVVLGYFYVRHRGKGRSGRLLQWLLPIPDGENISEDVPHDDKSVP